MDNRSHGRPTSDLLAGPQRAAAAMCAGLVLCLVSVEAADPSGPLARNDPRHATVAAGLKFLESSQLRSGGWNSGEHDDRSRGDAASTAIAGLAFLRAGRSPRDGDGARALTAAAAFVCGAVEDAPAGQVSLGQGDRTLIQRKLGTASDTALALWFLVDVASSLPEEASRTRAEAAIDELIRRLHRSQQPDGTWRDGEHAWAPALSQAILTRAIHRAKQQGYRVPEGMLSLLSAVAVREIDVAANAAGIDLYADAARLAAVHAEAQTLRSTTARASLYIMAHPKKTDEAAIAAGTRRALAEARLVGAESHFVARMKDSRYLDGHGSDGGEEYLSYVLIGDVLHFNKSRDWPDWNRVMTARLKPPQNPDGSWSGNHCITDRVFCTATAIMALLSDRARQWEAAP